MRFSYTSLLTWLLVASGFMITRAVHAEAPSQTLFLLSADMKVCSSDRLSACTKKGKNDFSEHAKSGAVFNITEEALVRVNEYPWTEQDNVRQQILMLLKQVQPKFENSKQPLSERLLVRQLRRLTIEYQHETLTGRDVWSSMFEFEKRNLFDLLEQKQLTNKNRRAKVEVNLAQTNNKAALAVWQEFYSQAKAISGKRTPRVAFITGANRDPYAEVDYYQALFSELGFDTQWLAIDGAMQTAQAAKIKDKSACNQLEQFQVQRLASFRRKVLYPDLYKAQLTQCRNRDPFMDTLKRSDAVFIADGSPLLAYHAFYAPSSKPSNVLTKLLAMYHKNQVVIGVAGNAVNAVTSLAGKASIVAGEGVALNGIQKMRFSSGNAACSLGVDCHALESQRALVYLESGILPLLPFGLVDNQMSRKSRQVRALNVALENDDDFVLGFDQQSAAKLTLQFDNKNPGFDIEMYGAGGLWLLDGSNNQSRQSVTQFTSHYLTHQDKAKVKPNSIKVEFASWKQATHFDGNTPNVTSAQVFSRSNYRQLHNMLCMTGAKSATGSAQVGEHEYEVVLESQGSGFSRKGTLKQGNRHALVCSFSGINNQISQKMTHAL